MRSPTPAALVVCTPGMPLSAYAPLVDALESAGLDAWTLSFPPEAQDAAAISGQWLPQVVEQLSADRRIAVVGEGLGGTLAALSVDARAIQPDALALLGSPLRTEPVGLYDWLATLPPPAEDLSLSAVSDASWRGMGVLELMLGAPMPTLEAVSAAWLTQLQAWTGGGLSVDLRDDGVPVWAGASGLDNLAPPEWVRPAVPPTAFFRFGYLRFEPEDPDHLGLISSPRALRMLSRWAATTLRTP
jgi:hypothetical protein